METTYNRFYQYNIYTNIFKVGVAFSVLILRHYFNISDFVMICGETNHDILLRPSLELVSKCNDQIYE